MSEELRPRGEQRHERGLIDVTELRMEAADDEVEFVAEEAVVRVGDEVEQGDRRRRDGRRTEHCGRR